MCVSLLRLYHMAGVMPGKLLRLITAKRSHCCLADPVTCKENVPLKPLVPAVLLSFAPQVRRTPPSKQPWVAFGPRWFQCGSRGKAGRFGDGGSVKVRDGCAAGACVVPRSPCSEQLERPGMTAAKGKSSSVQPTDKVE